MDKLTWYGHGAVGLELGGHQVLVDPFLGGNPAASITPDKVPANFILISHGHGDHVGDAIAIAKRTGATIISNFEIANWCQSQGAPSTHAQHLGGGFKHPFGYVKLTLALHGSGLPDGSYGGNPCGFLITTPRNKIYLACDTGLFGDMQLIGDEVVDVATLPIGDNFTMGPADALRAVKLIRPTHVIPLHYSTWDLIKQDANAWAKDIEAQTKTKAHVLKPGESFALG